METIETPVKTVTQVGQRFLDQTLGDLCWPAFAYLVIAAFVFLTGIMERGSVESLVLLVAMSLMTWLLNTLCKQKKTGLSWAVLIAILSGVVVFRYAALLVGVVAVL